jgi:hypothetical protein
MQATRLDSLLDNVEPRHDLRRVSAEHVEGYVLDPWSGLYQETETAYRDRLRIAEALSA